MASVYPTDEEVREFFERKIAIWTGSIPYPWNMEEENERELCNDLKAFLVRMIDRAVSKLNATVADDRNKERCSDLKKAKQKGEIVMKVSVSNDKGQVIWEHGTEHGIPGGIANRSFAKDGTQSKVIEILEIALGQAKAELSLYDVDRIPDVGASPAEVKNDVPIP